MSQGLMSFHAQVFTINRNVVVGILIVVLVLYVATRWGEYMCVIVDLIRAKLLVLLDLHSTYIMHIIHTEL